MNELASLGFILLFALFAGHVGKLLRIPMYLTLKSGDTRSV